MQLQDIENSILDETQQSELVNFGGPPNWANSTNPLLSRALIDFRINRAYIKAMKDVANLELAGLSVTFNAIPNQEAYALPPPVLGGMAPNPPVHLIQRLYYTPDGYTRELEFEPGIRLVDWKTFQRWTRAGYLRQVAYGNIPALATVTPDRTQLVFFPGPIDANDVIRIVYSPVPTAGSAVPLLADEEDVPLLPDECQDLIVQGALPNIWRRLREFGAAKEAEFGIYPAILKELKEDCLKRTSGDKLRFTLAGVDFMTSAPLPPLPWPG